MAQWLEKGTSVIINLGPFLDEDDGKTIEDGLTITRPDIQLSKNGGAFDQTETVATLSHDADGWYPATLGTTDTGTLGSLVIQVHESGALPVWREFMVVPSNVWDSMFGADKLDVAVVEVSSAGQEDIWETDALAEAYAADGSAAKPNELLYMLLAALTEFAISGTTITAKKLDGSTTAATFTLDDADNPTSRTRAS